VKEDVMSKSAVAITVAVVALAVGFAVGFAVAKSALIQFNALVIVGPDPATLTPSKEVTLHAEKFEQMTWRSDDGRDLVISFPVDKFPTGANGNEPFEDMKKVAGPDGKDEFVFVHPFGPNVAVSPKIKKAVYDLVKAGAVLEYKYDQTLGSKRADGKIIIRW
jgi:hypothetical protein